MHYINIKKEIQNICTDLLSIVKVKDYDYTNQPNNTEIMNAVIETIIELEQLKLKIYKDNDYYTQTI